MFRIYCCSALAFLLAGTCIFAQNPNDKEDKIVVRRVPRSKINSPEYKVSNFRIDQIRTLLKGKYDQRVNLPDPNVRKRIEAEINRLVPLNPRTKPDTRSVLDIKKSLEGKINAAFPTDLKALKQKAENEFDAKNPFAKRNSRVTVRYRRGSRVFRFSGNYYGRGLGGNTIRINSRNIPVVDLTEESKMLFDAQYHAEQKEKYAAGVINQYLRKKNAYASKLINAEYAKVRQKNERLGYILRNGWEPAKNIVDDYYNEMVDLYRVRAQEDARKRAEALKNNPIKAVVPKKTESEDDEEYEDEE